MTDSIDSGVAAELADAEDTSIGGITWHSSEEDGGPDVGISVYLGKDDRLYAGEISRRAFEEWEGDLVFDSDCGWFLVRYLGKDVQIIAKFGDENEYAKEFMEQIAAWVRRPPAVASPAERGLHPDTQDLIEKLSWALSSKLRRAQIKYGYSNGWLTDDWEDECREQLKRHLEKGDPLDVVAYAAFMWAREWSTVKAAARSPSVSGAAMREALERADAALLSIAMHVLSDHEDYDAIQEIAHKARQQTQTALAAVPQGQERGPAKYWQDLYTDLLKRCDASAVREALNAARVALADGAVNSPFVDDALKKIDLALASAPVTEGREALIKAGDELYSAFTGRGLFTDGQVEALHNYAAVSNHIRALASKPEAGTKLPEVDQTPLQAAKQEAMHRLYGDRASKPESGERK